MKKFFLLTFIFLSIFNYSSANFIFSTNLKQGDRSQDVKNLQIFLNSQPDTVITSNGPGSPGNETDYFGNLTKNAVIKFQNKYKSEVLTPVGLNNGTGFVGPLTRQKINSLSSKTVDSRSLSDALANNPSQSLLEALNIQTVNTRPNIPIRIDSVVPDNPSPGEIVNIYGHGFTQTSKVYLDEDQVSMDFVNDKNIKIRVPSNLVSPTAKVLSIKRNGIDTFLISPIYIFITNQKVANSNDPIMKNSLSEFRKFNQSYSRHISQEENNKDTKISLIENIKLKLNNINIFSKAHAQSLSLGGFGNIDYFGGYISGTTYCTCLYNLAVILDIEDIVTSDTITTAYSIIRGSKLRENYNIFSSNINVIGGFSKMNLECENLVTVYPMITCESSGDEADSVIDQKRGIGTAMSPSI